MGLDLHDVPRRRIPVLGHHVQTDRSVCLDVLSASGVRAVLSDRESVVRML